MKQRIQSLDVVRGLIMVLMAIDHVRVYSGVPAGGPDAGVFFTRWITHFCAPGFAFFAGTAIFLHGRKLANTNKLASFLVTRGLLLVFLEVTIIRFFWTFNFNYGDFFLAGVIWMLGWCMVLMALFIRLTPVAAGIAGLAIIAFQDLFALVPRMLSSEAQTSFGRFWEFIYSSGLQAPDGVTILYVIVPWIGVMAAGYGFGLVFEMDEAKRKRLCVRIGLTSIIFFVIIGTIVVMNKPADSRNLPFIMDLLNQRKYPASQLYILMTMGPLILLLPYVEKAKGWLVGMLVTFGRVPMFYYLCHILLIHLSALVVNMIINGGAHGEWYATAPYTWIEDESARWSLPLLYLVFFLDVVILYFLCRWYARYKATSTQAWTSYL